MSAPPIGMMISTPSTKAMNVTSQKSICALRHDEPVDEEHQRQHERDVDDVADRAA